MIFHVKAAQNFAAERYGIDFDGIFLITASWKLVAEHCEIDFDMVLHFEALQNFVAKHYGTGSRFWHDIPLVCSSKIGCRTLCKWFLHDFSFKGGSTLCRALYERNFDMIFHFMAAQKLVVEHCKRDFDLIFRLKAYQNLVVEHCEIVNEIFRWFFTLRGLNTWFKVGCKLAEHSERFWHDFSLYGGSTLGCRALWKILTLFFTLWWLKTWLQSIMEEDGWLALLLWQWTKIGSI